VGKKKRKEKKRKGPAQTPETFAVPLKNAKSPCFTGQPEKLPEKSASDRERISPGATSV
jgi:hypothetical protein